MAQLAAIDPNFDEDRDQVSAEEHEFAAGQERLADLIAARVQPKELMKPREAAPFLGFTWDAFRQAKWRKEIPFVRIGIKKFYKLEDLRTFIDNHRTLPRTTLNKK